MDGLPDLPTVLLPFWSARQWVGGCFRRIANYIRQYTGVYHHSHREKPSGRLYSIREYYDGTNADRRGGNVKCWNIRIDENSLVRNRVDCYFCPCRKSSEAALRSQSVSAHARELKELSTPKQCFKAGNVARRHPLNKNRSTKGPRSTISCAFWRS
jgi:hypothetical protein